MISIVNFVLVQGNYDTHLEAPLNIFIKPCNQVKLAAFNFVGLMESLELELKIKSKNIMMTRICLGGVNTPMIQSLGDGMR